MAVKLPTLLILALSVFTIVFSAPVPIFGETNAQRLARGLPPSPPRFLRAVEARNGPTRASSSRRSVTSPLPPVTLTGRLDVRNKDGSTVGHVRNWPGGGTIGGTSAFSPEGDLLVTLTYNPSDPTQINILSTNPAFPAPFYVAAGTSFSVTVPTLASGSGTSVPFTNVKSTPSGSGPVGSGDGYVESAIWTIDPATKQLTAQWINQDGSLPPTVFSYDIRNNHLFFTGDIAVYNTQASFLASAVDLFLIPI